ncbi:MAG: N-acetylmuramoyl-L-alanine amidase [Vicinamibacterales bacterium]
MRQPALKTLVPVRAALLCGLLTTLLFDARPASQNSTAAYTVYSSEGRRSLPFRTNAGVDFVSLDQLASMFNLTTAEDTVVGGLTVRGAGQTILLIPGQSFASVGPGRIVSLPAPVQRERNSWQVPVDFIRQALGPALNLRVDLRRTSHVILLGDVRLPQVGGHVERQGANVHVQLDVEPGAPYRASRDGNRLTLQFDAVALELTPITGLVPEFVAGVRAEGPALVLTLGPSTAGYRIDDSDRAHLQIDLLAPGAPPPTPTRPQEPTSPPVVDLAPPGTLRTLVIDPGHGGEDEGVRGAGIKEKDFVLQVARRLKSAIEARIGLRVLLTRNDDTDVAADKRAALANNNKADLFISLHANASVNPKVGGVQVLSLRVDDYRSSEHAQDNAEIPVPVVGGGLRTIDVVAWDIAQIPFAAKSATLATMLLRRCQEQGLPMFKRPTAQLPLRPLVGVNMPAILVELGFLSNPDEEKALTTGDRTQKIIDALLATIADARRGITVTPVAPATP